MSRDHWVASLMLLYNMQTESQKYEIGNLPPSQNQDVCGTHTRPSRGKTRSIISLCVMGNCPKIMLESHYQAQEIRLGTTGTQLFLKEVDMTSNKNTIN